MVVNDLLITDAQVFGQLVLFWQHSEVALVIGGVHMLVDRIEQPYPVYDLTDEIIVVYQILATQMVDTAFITIDEVVDLLSELIVMGHIYDKVRKNLDSLVFPNGRFDLFDPGGGIPENHGQA